jgi:hypothetical protein
MECEYCKRILKTKSSLNAHHRNAKYCLKIRNIVISKYKCPGCKNTFSKKYNLKIHKQKCPIINSDLYDKHIQLVKDFEELTEKYISLEKTVKSIRNVNIDIKTVNKLNICHKEEINRLHGEIHILQDKLADTALAGVKKHTTVNTINNIIQNLEPITPELLEEHSKYLTIEHIKKGPAGYAEYALDHPFKDKVVCVDYARRKAKYKDPDGSVVTDPKLTKLTRLLFKSIAEKNRALALEYSDTISKDLNLSDRVQMMNDVIDALVTVDSSADGIDSEFHNRFAEKVCGGTIPCDDDEDEIE